MGTLIIITVIGTVMWAINFLEKPEKKETENWTKEQRLFLGI